MTGHVVGDESGGDAVLLQFPSSEPRALQERTGFIGVYVDLLPVADGRPDDTERRPIARGR